MKVFYILYFHSCCCNLAIVTVETFCWNLLLQINSLASFFLKVNFQYFEQIYYINDFKQTLIIYKISLQDYRPTT